MAEIIKIKGRFSYLSLFEPRTIKNVKDSKPAYSGCLIIDPSTKEGRREIAKIEKAIEDAKEEGVTKCANWGGRIPKKLQILFWKDGNDRDKEEKNPEYDDMMIFSARASIEYKPQVVDRDPEVIINDPKKIQSGDYGYFAVRIFPYDTGSNGIGCALNFVQWLKKGEPLAGGGDPTKIFNNEEDEDDDTPPKKKKTTYEDLM